MANLTKRLMGKTGLMALGLLLLGLNFFVALPDFAGYIGYGALVISAGMTLLGK